MLYNKTHLKDFDIEFTGITEVNHTGNQSRLVVFVPNKYRSQLLSGVPWDARDMKEISLPRKLLVNVSDVGNFHSGAGYEVNIRITHSEKWVSDYLSLYRAEVYSDDLNYIRNQIGANKAGGIHGDNQDGHIMLGSEVLGDNTSLAWGVICFVLLGIMALSLF